MNRRKFEKDDLVDLNWNVEFEGLRSQKEVFEIVTRRIGPPPWKVKSFYNSDRIIYLFLYNKSPLRISSQYRKNRFIRVGKREK